MQDCYLVASDGDCILGFAHAERGRYLRNQHSANVVIGLLPRARGRGLGTRLLGAIEDRAVRDGVSRLELTVMVHNTAAIGLYRKCGYVQEGVRRRSLIVDGRPVDELSMAKLLP
jgi:RimJ/RimL family protein N-acetyltransferase